MISRILFTLTTFGNSHFVEVSTRFKTPLVPHRIVGYHKGEPIYAPLGPAPPKKANRRQMALLVKARKGKRSSLPHRRSEARSLSARDGEANRPQDITPLLSEFKFMKDTRVRAPHPSNGGSSSNSDRSDPGNEYVLEEARSVCWVCMTECLTVDCIFGCYHTHGEDCLECVERGFINPWETQTECSACLIGCADPKEDGWCFLRCYDQYGDACTYCKRYGFLSS